MDIGGRLRHARESKGLTIDAVSRCTRVQPRILSAIEQNDTVSLPPRPYGRGFVRAYASEVGLDPDSTVRDYFMQFAPPDQHEAEARPRTPDALPRRDDGHRRWLWPLGAVLGYAAVGALVILIGRWAFRTAGEPGAVGTTGSAVPVAAPAIAREVTPPAQAPPARDITIALHAERPSWVTAHVDGQRTVYRALAPGETVSLRGAREVSVRTGDAGAVTWQVNGRPAVPMGRPGEVRTVRVTPETAALAQ